MSPLQGKGCFLLRSFLGCRAKSVLYSSSDISLLKICNNWYMFAWIWSHMAVVPSAPLSVSVVIGEFK